jgi:cell division protein FtsB
MQKENVFKIGVFCMIALLAYFAYLAVGQQKLISEKNAELKRIQAKIQDETEVNEELNKVRESINSDEYIEKVAREKLNMVKNGEKVFVDVGSD